MFYENLKKLCSQKGITVTVLCNELGFSSGNMSRWKNGAAPGSRSIAKIADYFNISVDYLLGTEKEKPSLAPDLTDEEKTLLELYRSIPAEKRPLVLQLLQSL